MRSRLVCRRADAEFRVAICGVLRDGVAGEVDADASVVGVAVEQACVQRMSDGGLEILSAGRPAAGDVLVAADEVGLAEEVLNRGLVF